METDVYVTRNQPMSGMKNALVSIYSRSNRYLCKWSHLNVPRGTLSEQLGWQRGLNLVPNSGTRFFYFLGC